MACHVVQMWSLSGLVAAFLDLTIAYLLLCGSAVAYFASKFLGFFGLSLPCPCDGMFINDHSRSLCFNKLLVDFPIQKLSDVQLSVKQKIPFGNSVSPKKSDCGMAGDDCGILELEDEVCSSSISDARGSGDVVRRELSLKTGKIDLKGKGVFGYRPRSRLRPRKGIWNHGKNLSIFSYDCSVDEQPYQNFSTNKRGTWFVGDGSPCTDTTVNHNLEYVKAPKKQRARRRTLSRDEMNLSPDEDMNMKRSTLSIEEQQDIQQGIEGCVGDENSKIKHLEQALEKERAACAALCINLEEERSAAASAADEAMAMILRLQEEKASVEMEARQYKRIIEEKSVYDDEEMNILQEILVRREKEKLFLEDEVEAYRQMFCEGNEQFNCGFSDNNDGEQIFDSQNDHNDGPVSVMHQLAASTDKDITIQNKEIRNLDENCINMSIQNSSGKMQLTPKALLEGEKSIPCHTKDLEQVHEMNHGPNLSKKVIRTCYGTEKGDPNFDSSLKQQELGYRSSYDPIQDKDPHVYDVHIIDDGINLFSETTEDKGDRRPFSDSLKVCEADSVQSGAARDVIADSPSVCRLETEAAVKKISSEVTSCLPPTGRRYSTGLRRSSTCSMDNEMLKIDSEIIQLQDRLKLVQEERGKLGISLENRESKSSQLRILEDIALQIQKIRRLSEPEKAARQASLPIPNAKGFSKKRRSRSASQMTSPG